MSRYYKSKIRSQEECLKSVWENAYPIVQEISEIFAETGKILNVNLRDIRFKGYNPARDIDPLSMNQVRVWPTFTTSIGAIYTEAIPGIPELIIQYHDRFKVLWRELEKEFRVSIDFAILSLEENEIGITCVMCSQHMDEVSYYPDIEAEEAFPADYTALQQQLLKVTSLKFLTIGDVISLLAKYQPIYNSKMSFAHADLANRRYESIRERCGSDFDILVTQLLSFKKTLV